MRKLDFSGGHLHVKRGSLTLPSIIGSLLIGTPISVWIGNKMFESLVRLQISGVFTKDERKAMFFTGVIQTNGNEQEIYGKLDTLRRKGWLKEGTVQIEQLNI
ncbi:MAG: hypothetical protein U9M98_03245 [Patescibacteria group bacterium]|nr:hypothetical protein [Patescibacteria group bacterium]